MERRGGATSASASAVGPLGPLPAILMIDVEVGMAVAGSGDERQGEGLDARPVSLTMALPWR